MNEKFYFKRHPAYVQATISQKKRIGDNSGYELKRLPTLPMQEEMEDFLIHRSKECALETFCYERKFFSVLCRFLEKKSHGVKSFHDRSKEDWLRQLKTWMMEEEMPLIYERQGIYGKYTRTQSPQIRYFKKILDFMDPKDERKEIEKDIWEIKKLDIPIRDNPIRNYRIINFTQILQTDMKEETKKGIYFNLPDEAISTVCQEMAAVKRLSKFLMKNYPLVQSYKDISRELFEEYLNFLRTDDTTKKNYHAELTRLRAILESIGKTCGYLQLEELFLKRDIPSKTEAKFKTYSDKELKRLNAQIVKMDEQIARVMIIHQMLGTRISDTLTLEVNCLYDTGKQTYIKIHQMKTKTFEKPVSSELAALIRKAIQYTEEKFGQTKYIFVDAKNPEKPLQYSTLQEKIVSMIYKKDLRDDNGRLFGFGTHMYRHYYGVKLTEMHLDDWTLARLLGHSSISSLKYYRKLSNQLMAEETRRARQLISEMILANLDGWGEEYEQVRQDDFRE